jgi:hypothetical protein
VYDGRRRYDLIFTDRGTARMEASSYAFYTGPAHACALHVRRIAGHTAEEFDAAVNEGSIWIASVLPGGPVVPVRIMWEGRFGTTVVHLAEIHRGSEHRAAGPP